MIQIIKKSKIVAVVMAIIMIVMCLLQNVVALELSINADNACEINGVKYATLDDALATVPDKTPTVIKMLNDFTDSDGISLSWKKVELDLNGKSLYIKNSAGNGIELQLLSELNITGSGAIYVDAKNSGLSMNQSKFIAPESVTVEINSASNEGLYTDTECTVDFNGNVSGFNGGIYASSYNTITISGSATSTGDKAFHAVTLNRNGNTVMVGSAIVSAGTGSGIHLGSNSGGNVTVGSALTPGKVIGKGNGINAGSNTTVTIYGDVEGGSHGISAGSGSTITVYGNVKSTAVGADLYGVYCFANSDPANIIIHGNVEGVNGIYIHGGQSKLTVNGNVTSTGTDLANNIGARASYAWLYINGSVIANSCVGAYSFQSSEIIIDGTITAANYIKVKYEDKTIDNADVASSKSGYLQYSSTNAFVWVKEAQVIQVSNSTELLVALGNISNGGIIKLTSNINLNSRIIVDGKTITFDVGTYILNATNATGNGLEVKNNGHVKLIGTGAFNVICVGTGNTGNYNGVVARKGCTATVTNATTTNIHGRGAYSEYAGSIITILGNIKSTGIYGYGVQVWSGGTIIVNGTITANNKYLAVDSASMSPSEGVPDPLKVGYLNYSFPNNVGVIWVKSTVPVIYTCEINGVKYETLDVALDSIPDDGLATIKLLMDINHNAGVVLNGKKITFNLNGYTLNIDNPAQGGTGLNAYNGGSVYLVGLGALNVTGKYYGVTVASNSALCEVTVNNVTVNGTEGKAAHAYNKATLVVLGDVTATGARSFGVHSQFRAYIEVRGNVKADHQGVCVSDASAKVFGNITANGNDLIGNPEGIGVNVYDGTAEVLGNVVANRVGAMIRAGGSITIDGTLEAPNYIKFVDDAPTTINGYLATTIKAGYRTYQHTTAGTVFVKGDVLIVTYTLTVIGGTGGGNFAQGTTVTITANAAAFGKEFDKWITTDGVIFANENAQSTSFVMPAGAVNVTATYKDLPPVSYDINILNDGNGTASAKVTTALSGEIITLTAVPNSDYRFKAWEVISGGVTIIDNKFTMPSNAVNIKAIFEKIIKEPIEYKIIKGANNTWTEGTTTGVEIISDGDFSKFIELKIDGVVIDSQNYTAVSGSTIITLKAEYIKTLIVGAHTIEFIYQDGSVETEFTVVKADNTSAIATTTTLDSSDTDDDSSNPLWFILITLGGVIIVISAVFVVKKVIKQPIK